MNLETQTVRLSKCPHCGARGCKQVAPIFIDGLLFDTNGYCGKCGRNYPNSDRQPPDDNGEAGNR